MINSPTPSMAYLQDLHDLLKEIISLFANKKDHSTNKNIMNIHPGGKQTLQVYECVLEGKKVAVKIYKPILTHLIVHTIATEYIMSNIDYFNTALDKPLTLHMPRILALGYTASNSLLSQVSILIQEWVDNGQEIYKQFPQDHVKIIRSIVKKLTTENGLMVDIMGKNWLKTEKNHLEYIDLVLFNPKGPIVKKIKKLATDLNFHF